MARPHPPEKISSLRADSVPVFAPQFLTPEQQGYGGSADDDNRRLDKVWGSQLGKRCGVDPESQEYQKSRQSYQTDNGPPGAVITLYCGIVAVAQMDWANPSDHCLAPPALRD